jgi:hypothetical protein
MTPHDTTCPVQIMGAGTTDTAARREVEAYHLVMVVWELFHAARSAKPEAALQRLSKIAFLPLKLSRVESCVRGAASLHPALVERRSDVLAVAADSIAILMVSRS